MEDVKDEENVEKEMGIEKGRKIFMIERKKY